MVGDNLVKERARVVAVPTFQIWKGGKMIDKYVAGQSLGEAAGSIVQMTDRHLDCGFSLSKKIDGSVEDRKAAMLKEVTARPQTQIPKP